MPDIVISEFMDEDVVASAFDGRDYVYDPKLVDQPDDLKAALSDARAIVVRNRTQVRGDLLDAAPNLKVVGRLGVGLDNIDLDACAARGITVCPASGANDLSVAEYVITAAMLLLRTSWLSSASVAAGDWPRMALVGREMSGKALGLIGYGAIARETASRAKALGMNILAYDPYLPADDAAWADAQNMELGDLLAAADVISLHVPLTDSTKHLINADAIAKMKSDAIVINAARGGVVDEAALAQALKDGALGGAALDVFETEPLTAEQGEKFSDLSNIVLTPHIAGVTSESNVRVSQVTADNVLSHLK